MAWLLQSCEVKVYLLDVEGMSCFHPQHGQLALLLFRAASQLW